MAEERKSRRFTTAKIAHIVFDHGEQVVRCSLANLSETGVAITLTTDEPIPHIFDLLFEADIRRKVIAGVWRNDQEMVVRPCATVWRRGLRVGLKFLEAPRGVAEQSGAAFD